MTRMVEITSEFGTVSWVNPDQVAYISADAPREGRPHTFIQLSSGAVLDMAGSPEEVVAHLGIRQGL